MSRCEFCGDPITGGSVPLVGEDGQRVEVHGQCLLKSYPGKAFQEDKPDRWTATSDSIEEHTEHMARKNGVTTYGGE